MQNTIITRAGANSEGSLDTIFNIVTVGDYQYVGRSRKGTVNTANAWRIQRIKTDGTEIRWSDSSVAWDSGAGVDPEARSYDVYTLTIASNNSTTTLAKTGDIVTITVVTDENVNTVSATLGGFAMTIVPGIDDKHFTATRTLTGSEPIGLFTFAVTYFDGLGNKTVITKVTTGNGVTYDRTVPTFTTATMVSNNANTDYATTGDVVTLTIISSELLIAKPTVTIAGVAINASAVTQGIDAAHFTATFTTLIGGAEGLIAFTLNGNDLSGNAATQRTTLTGGVGVIFDKTVPVASTVTMASNNADPTKAKTGDVITLTVITDDAIGTPVITIQGVATTEVMGIDNKHWTATYTTQAGDSNGAIPFILDFTNKAGLVGTQVTVVTTGSAVTFDKTIGTFSTATMASNNTTTTLAKVGDVVTLTIVASEALLAKPVVTIGGNVVAPVNVTWTTGANASATYTMVTGDTEGLVALTIDGVDLAGNALTQCVALTGGSGVTFDKTAPLMTGAGNDGMTTLIIVLDTDPLPSTITKANAGGFTVHETGAPATTYAISAIAPGISPKQVVCTIADMTASATPGVTAKYTAGGNGTVSDYAGNILATDATGVATGEFL